jgi:hypothetical protein
VWRLQKPIEGLSVLALSTTKRMLIPNKKYVNDNYPCTGFNARTCKGFTQISLRHHLARHLRRLGAAG